jgi:hypothetical protein
LSVCSLRVRVALWYSCALILVALMLGGASRWGTAVSRNHALDQGALSADRVPGIYR